MHKSNVENVCCVICHEWSVIWWHLTIYSKEFGVTQWQLDKKNPEKCVALPWDPELFSLKFAGGIPHVTLSLDFFDVIWCHYQSVFHVVSWHATNGKRSESISRPDLIALWDSIRTPFVLKTLNWHFSLANWLNFDATLKHSHQHKHNKPEKLWLILWSFRLLAQVAQSTLATHFEWCVLY